MWPWRPFSQLQSPEIRRSTVLKYIKFTDFWSSTIAKRSFGIYDTWDYDCTLTHILQYSYNAIALNWDIEYEAEYKRTLVYTYVVYIPTNILFTSIVFCLCIFLPFWFFVRGKKTGIFLAFKPVSVSYQNSHHICGKMCFGTRFTFELQKRWLLHKNVSRVIVSRMMKLCFDWMFVRYEQTLLWTRWYYSLPKPPTLSHLWRASKSVFSKR